MTSATPDACGCPATTGALESNQCQRLGLATTVGKPSLKATDNARHQLVVLNPSERVVEIR